MADTAAIAASSFCDIVADHARNQGDVIAFTYGEEEFSFAALDAGANRTANGLIALGVKPGDRVAFLGKNHPLYFEAFVGAARIGAVMTPVNWRLAPPEVAYILDNCGANVVFVAEGFAAMIEGVREAVPHVQHIIGIDAPEHDGLDYRSWRDGFPATPPKHVVKSEDDALQLYTSGTTGKPKGAVMTHGSILSSRDALAAADEMRGWQEPIPGDVTLLAMPCFHISGTGTGIGTMVAGTNSIVLPEYDPTKALDLIANFNISKIFLVPAAIQILLNHPRVNEVDFSRLKYITYGASPIPLELMREAMRVIGCGFVQMYGMTETSGTIVALDPEDHVP
jgi:acyl-CoA synthetase (AMP-forming)/AMP-acid ligase II